MKKIVIGIALLFNSYSYGRIAVTVQAEIPTRSAAVTTSMHLGAGFFCEFGKVIKNLIHHQKDGICSFTVDWTNQFFPYKTGIDDNGWDYYFEPIKIYHDEYDPNEPILKGGGDNHELHDQTCVAPWLRYEDYLPLRKYAHDIIEKYIRIKQPILDKLDQLYNQNLKGYLCIGVHVRYATSHISESPGGHPSLEDYCHEVSAILNQHSDKPCKIFLATDSDIAVNHFRKRFGDRLFYLDTLRSAGSDDPHLIYDRAYFYIDHPDVWHREKPGYRGGEGVLLDCLLLSKCDYFIHTMSNVSTYVTFFNPYIKSIYLPRGLPFKHCGYYGNPDIRNPYLNPI